MELFGIGPLELLFILLLVIIIFGPKDIQRASRTLGNWLRKLVQSDTWKLLTQTSRRLKTLPNDLMREAQMEELQKTLAPIRSDLQADLEKRRAVAKKSSDSLVGESWIAEPEPSDERAPDDLPDEPLK